MEQEEFSPSDSEIKRRKQAFVTLLASLYAGFIASSLIIQKRVSWIACLAVGMAFIASALLLFRFLNSLKSLRVSISGTGLERRTAKTLEYYSLSAVYGMRIKRRTNRLIREITITLDDGRHLSINGFEDSFEDLKDAILRGAGKDVSPREVIEPMDFDNPLFYALLGLPISFLAVALLSVLSSYSVAKMRIVMFATAAYAFGMALYFALKKPISASYGRLRVPIDYTSASIMAVVAIGILIIGFML